VDSFSSDQPTDGPLNPFDFGKRLIRRTILIASRLDLVLAAGTNDDIMKMVCAWCNARMGGQGMQLSHGICNRCFSLMLQRQFEFMDGLPYVAGQFRRARRPNTRRAASPQRSQPYLSLF